MKNSLILSVGAFLLFFTTKIFSQGNGSDGALTIGAGTTTINATKSGVSSTASSGQKIVNVTSSSGFATGNLVLVIQMLGTNVGVWEEATIASIAGNALTMNSNLINTYTKTGTTSLAQVIKIPQYTNLTVGNGRTLTASAWDGTTGGVLIFYVNGTLTVDGIITMAGKGYRGGAGAAGVSGPNPAGAGGAAGGLCANGSDGAVVAGTGASGSNKCGSCGAGRGGEGGLRGTQAGATGTAGEGPGGGAGGSGTGAVGGDNFTSCNTSSCTIMQMGSGGGGGKAGDVSIAGGGGGGGGGASIAGTAGSPGSVSAAGGNGGNGGNGGGIIRICCNVFAGAATGVITADGGNGGNGTNGGTGGSGGAGGAGGSSAPNSGGAGGGGQGANGSGGGGAGAFGAGGVNYIIKITKTFTGTQTSAHGAHGSVGAGGSANIGNIGGAIPCGGAAAGTGTNGTTGANGLPGVDPAGGGDGNIILPIELIQFNVEQRGEAAGISWVTASETNNDYFTIEKSKNLQEWSPVTNIAGAGNSTTKKYYSYQDYDHYSGLSFYRMKQTDYDGRFSYSSILSIDFNANEENVFNVYPTRSIGNFNISFSGQKDKPLLIVVRNVLGQEFYSNGFVLDTDFFVQPMELSGILTPGIYLVIASSDDHVFSRRIIINN